MNESKLFISKKIKFYTRYSDKNWDLQTLVLTRLLSPASSDDWKKKQKHLTQIFSIKIYDGSKHQKLMLMVTSRNESLASLYTLFPIFWLLGFCTMLYKQLTCRFTAFSWHSPLQSGHRGKRNQGLWKIIADLRMLQEHSETLTSSSFRRSFVQRNTKTQKTKTKV